MPIPDSLKKLQMKFNYRTEAEISGVKFGLQVLSLKDEQKVQAQPSDDLDGLSYYSELQKGMLAYAIRVIDDEELPDVIEEDSGDGKKSSKERAVYVREILAGLPHKVTESLFEVYIDLREQKEDEITKSLTYSWYKTPEQREEERKRKERLAEEEANREKEAEESPDSGATGIPSVPSPDEDIDLKRLPADYSEDGGSKEA